MIVGPDSSLEPDVRALLEEHLVDMRRVSPPESVHALPAEALAAPGVVLLSARDAGGALLGCGALVPLPDDDAEVKAMRTAPEARSRGVGAAVLAALVEAARARGVRRLLLETGTEPAFDAAVRLYLRHGFTPCGPFAAYTDDPHSRYFVLTLRAAAGTGDVGRRF